MLERLFYDENGSLRSVDPKNEEALWASIVECIGCRDGDAVKTYHEHCQDCLYGDRANRNFITRLNRWINRSELAEKEIDKELLWKDDRALGRELQKKNDRLPTPLRIGSSALEGWCYGSRDPSNRPTAWDSRENVYKLCSVLGISGDKTITEFFRLVIHAEPFMRLEPLEICFERFIKRGAKNWLALSYGVCSGNFDRGGNVSFDGNSHENGDENDDEYAAFSVAENRRLSDREFMNAAASLGTADKTLSLACKTVEQTAFCTWTKINQIRDHGQPMDRSIKGKQIIGPILFGEGCSSVGAKEFKVNDVEDLRQIGAARNFPTSAALSSIRRGKTNREQLRRTLILLLFGASFITPAVFLSRELMNVHADPYEYYSYVSACRRDPVGEFLADCDHQLDKLSLHRLNVNDGFDALILFCCCTEDPLMSLRRRLAIHNGSARE